MKRIISLLLLSLTIHGSTQAQPSKGKRKAMPAKTKKAVKPSTQVREAQGAISIAVAKAWSALEKEMVKTSAVSDSSALDSSKQILGTVYKPRGWVNDFTDLFTLAQQTELDSLINTFEKATTVEIAIVTIDSTATSRSGFDDYITALGNRWGVGKKETHNGLVIGICPSYKRIRISTGAGIQQQLTDMETKAIIDNIIIPQYKQGRYFEGTRLGLLAVIRELTPSH